MKRLTLALVVASLAFAPAPLPRVRREPPPDVDLARFQGLWRAVRFETITPTGRSSDPNWAATQVRVVNDRWTFYEAGQLNASYRIRLDPAKKTAAIDFFEVNNNNGRLFMIGLIRRRGDRIEILYSSMTQTPRATSFDSPPTGWWVLTLRRDG